MTTKNTFSILLFAFLSGCSCSKTSETSSETNSGTTPVDTLASRGDNSGPLTETQENWQKLEDLKEKQAQGKLSTADGKKLDTLRFNTQKSVQVFFATDRRILDEHERKPDNIFGTSRGIIQYGTCLVNIPPKHSIGILESPSLLKLEFRKDLKKHLFVTNVQLKNASAFFGEVKHGVRATNRKSAFIFVHGYNVSFDEAARRTAQIACDINFDGVPAFFSWPSQASLMGYLVDETNIEWATQHLETFLKDFLEKSEAENVYCIAHSMGNRGLTRALISVLEKNPSLAPRVKELILAAPDIDQEIFTRDIAPMLTAKVPPITMYVSSKDQAIRASRVIHREPRAGEGPPNLMVLNGVETIDASHVDLSLLGHGYLAEERPVIEDLSWLIMHDTRAAQRQMLRQPKNKRYWEFRR